MASVASKLIDEVTPHAQRDSLEDARETYADGTYFPNNLRIFKCLIRKCLLHLRASLSKLFDVFVRFLRLLRTCDVRAFMVQEYDTDNSEIKLYANL